MSVDTLLRAVVAEQPYPLLFATISGAHLYGFPSPDSDYDLRGVHILPAREVLSLAPRNDTLDISQDRDGTLIDLVTHDAEKFLRLLLRKNGYVLEQLLSPLVVQTSPGHAELCELARGCVTRHHAHHYLGFARNQWQLFLKEEPRRVKPLLYVYRVLLTGLHLMQTGQVEANLVTLNAQARLPYIDELVLAKQQGESATLTHADIPFHEREVTRLLAQLDEARTSTRLPEAPTAGPALSDLLVRLRLATL
jgi:uncharacterized protein